jgi:hypothetical protein
MQIVFVIPHDHFPFPISFILRYLSFTPGLPHPLKHSPPPLRFSGYPGLTFPRVRKMRRRERREIKMTSISLSAVRKGKNRSRGGEKTVKNSVLGCDLKTHNRVKTV